MPVFEGKGLPPGHPFAGGRVIFLSRRSHGPSPDRPALSIKERVEGGLLGLLIGDALGVPYEFHAPEEIPATELIEFEPPPGFRRSHFGTPPGTWSDDGAQALVLLDSLLANDRLDLVHFASGLRRWLHEGFMAVGRTVFDVGAQTATAINRLTSGVPPQLSGPADLVHNGNGSLMRVLPLALWHRGTDADLVELAMRQSLPTHGHWHAQLCCAMYCLWARCCIENASPPWDAAAALTPSHPVRGSGYVVDTLWSAKRCVEVSTTYEDCVRHAIALGHDTDTTASVAGGIFGLLCGKRGIPVRWRENLRDAETYQGLLQRLDAARPAP